MNPEDLKNNPLYQYQKQVRDAVDAEIESMRKAEQLKLMREEREAASNDRIEAKKNAQLHAVEKAVDRKLALETKKTCVDRHLDKCRIRDIEFGYNCTPTVLSN